MTRDEFIEHEVKLRLHEERHLDFKETFKEIKDRMDSHFKWTMGSILMLLATMIALFGGLLIQLIV